MGLVIRKKNIESKNNLDASKPNLGTVDQAYFDYFMGQLLILIYELMNKEPIEIDIFYKDVDVKGVAISRRKRAWGF